MSGAGIGLTFVDEGLDFALQTAPGMGGRRLVSNFRALGLKFQRLIVGNLLNGAVLNRRTATGQRATFYRVEENDVAGVTLTVGSDLSKAPYMRALALGATITPKNGRYLAIPLEAARTGRGVARFSAADLRRNPSAVGYTSSFVKQGSTGVPIVFGVKDKKVVPLFVLKPSVTLPSRNYLLAAQTFLGADIREAVDDVAQVIVDETVRSSGGGSAGASGDDGFDGVGIS